MRMRNFNFFAMMTLLVTFMLFGMTAWADSLAKGPQTHGVTEAPAAEVTPKFLVDVQEVTLVISAETAQADYSKALLGMLALCEIRSNPKVTIVVVPVTPPNTNRQEHTRPAVWYEERRPRDTSTAATQPGHYKRTHLSPTVQARDRSTRPGPVASAAFYDPAVIVRIE
jgi:hypothetical protein